MQGFYQNMQHVEAFVNGTLDYNPDVKCNHHDHNHGEEHTCGDHGCGNHKLAINENQIRTLGFPS